SADAAAGMRGFLRLAEIEGIDSEIEQAALSLGADVPVCLVGKACRMQGVGERIVPLENFKPLHAVLVNPLIAVQTPAVFQKLGLAEGECRGASLTDLSDPAAWRNDLTLPAVALVPAIAGVIAVLENQQGIRFARMSGSGATCFGVFEKPDAARKAARAISALHPQWWVQQAILG
ncbi:MAG: 4-(cytidine 5'-diphospho)-2-C-methyl-D-erythritol kinase, partial [Rhizobiales bacterium]|nr:4-(cytidine 5'-diphospho)-2-C-methyl-D-erythritol kinase [Hyphomicrobiales bacterium]